MDDDKIDESHEKLKIKKLKLKDEGNPLHCHGMALRAPISAEATAIITFRILSQTDDFVLIKLRINS